jgi:hypothetical protein
MSVLGAWARYFSRGFTALAPYYYLTPLVGYGIFLPIIQKVETPIPESSSQKQSSGEAVKPEPCSVGQLTGIPNRKVDL